VLKFNTRIIKQSSSNTSCYIVCEATYFGPYMIIIRPSYHSSQEMLALDLIGKKAWWWSCKDRNM